MSKTYVKEISTSIISEWRENKCKFQTKNRHVKPRFFIDNLIFNLWVIDDSRNIFGFPIALMVISLYQLAYIKPFCAYINQIKCEGGHSKSMYAQKSSILDLPPPPLYAFVPFSRTPFPQAYEPFKPSDSSYPKHLNSILRFSIVFIKILLT